MQIPIISPPLQQINDALIQNSGVNLFLLRIDQMHPTVGGNKLFKLKYNLEEAKKEGKNCLLTFGGAFSNHIAATAAAGKENDFKTIGIIRGEEYKVLNPTLKFAVDNGMQLQYISRKNYQNKDSDKFLDSLNQQFENYYLIPEGGANILGIMGCKEITQYIAIDFDHVCCACGTGTTLTGIILTLKKNQTAIGFQSLKGRGYIKKEIENRLAYFGTSQNNWHIEDEYHFGGYAKTKTELIDFVNTFKKNNFISLDLIYTGKMMFGIYDMIKKGFFKKGATIVAIHTGGLQGNVGFGHLD